MRSVALIGALLAGQGLASPLAELKPRFSPVGTAPQGPVVTSKLPGPPFQLGNGTLPAGPTGVGKPVTPGQPGPGQPGRNGTTPMTTSTVFATNVYTVTSVYALFKGSAAC